MRLGSLLAIVVLSLGACGPKPTKDAENSGQKPPPATSAKPTASTERALCDRVCAPEAKCGAPKAECEKRCLTSARVLQTAVVEAMVACVEKKSPKMCDNSEAGQKARADLVSGCVLEATETKSEDTSASVGLFANGYCERTKECGVEGVFSKNECLGRARDSIRELPEVVLFGALRSTALDDLVACLKSTPCEKRSKDAGIEVKLCIGQILADAAGSTP
jgi:hypothetical protein